MAKLPDTRKNWFPNNPDLPLGSEDYPGRERFGDWTLDNIIPLNPGEVLVNEDPEGDPNKLARHGTKKPKKGK